ncbi:MAG: hypothetical protein ACOCXT_06780 [Candidatus Dojkabacteria bacterium]
MISSPTQEVAILSTNQQTFMGMQNHPLIDALYVRLSGDQSNVNIVALQEVSPVAHIDHMRKFHCCGYGAMQERYGVNKCFPEAFHTIQRIGLLKQFSACQISDRDWTVLSYRTAINLILP